MVTRARRTPAAIVFSGLCVLLATWSVSILGQRLTTDTDVAAVLLRVENGASALIPAIALTLAAAFGNEGPRPRSQTIIVVAALAASLGMAVISVVAPGQAWTLSPPHFNPDPIPGEIFGLTWIAARLAMLALAVAWLAIPLVQAGGDRARRQQLAAALVAIVIGAIGGALRIISPAAPTDPWIGGFLIAAALVTTAYAVFAQGVFLAPVVAGRAFLYSIIIGLGMTVVTAAVIALDAATRSALGLEVPIVAGLALVAAIALFDVAAERVRRLVGRADYAGSSERLQRALDDDLLTAQTPGQALEPALARLMRTFRLRGAALVDAAGAVIVQVGTSPAADSGTLRLPLPSTESTAPSGQVLFGGKRSHLPFTAQEMTLLAQAAAFLADLLDLEGSQQRQAESLDDLSRRKAGVDERGRELSRALGAVSRRQADGGLRVYALGPLRVEREGAPMTRWGGEKAGSRQAEAMFAFLFDRGERGVAKDEMLELVWPDVDLERADLAFHRTLGGLRGVLEPSRPARDRGEAIVFHHERYHLNPVLVVGSDVADLEAELAAAGQSPDPTTRLGHLERARVLFRGDYLDDCPYYGDSAAVEERRSLLRSQLVDLLLSLGELYEQRGDRPAAAACFRNARQTAGEPLPSAEAALSRLGSTA